jgi:hypothetical protein
MEQNFEKITKKKSIDWSKKALEELKHLYELSETKEVKTFIKTELQRQGEWPLSPTIKLSKKKKEESPSKTT